MKETIIYSNSLNQTEFLRSLSLMGKDTFGERVLNASELCDEANIRLGFPIKETYISPTEEISIIYHISKEVYEFTSFDDIKHIASTLSTMRMLIREEDEISTFKAKVRELFPDDQNTKLLEDIFIRYISYLNENHLMDKVSFMKKIISQNKKVFNEIVVFDDEFEELEWEFLYSLTDNLIITSIANFMNKEEVKEPVVKDISPFYGERNEIEGVLYDIFNNGYSLDDCSIVLANKEKYTYLLNEYIDRYDIPMSFETGLPITLSNPFKLYRALEKLEKESFFDVNGYKHLFLSEAFTDSYFDTLDYRLRMDAIEVLGRLKISFNAEENEKKINDFLSIDKDSFLTFMEKINKSMDIPRIVTLVQNIAKEFSKGKTNILKLCSVIREGKYNQIDKESLATIVAYLDDADKFDFIPSMRDSFLKQITGVYLKSSINKPGSLHITTLNKGFSTFRKHIYMVGFSANNFPGKAVEDYLLPNAAVSSLNGKSYRASEKIIKDKIKMFDKLLTLYSTLGLDIHLSYSCQNIKEVKDVNPSSAILKLIKDEKAFNKKKKEAGYFKNDVSKLSHLVEAFLSNKKLETKEVESKQEVQRDNFLDFKFSPSAISSFFECPLKFYLNSILRADKPMEYDYFNPLGGPVFGNLLHLVMEMIYKQNINENEVPAFIKKVFTDYQKFDVSLNDPEVNFEEFFESCMNAYEFLKDYNVVGTEVKVYGDVFGVKFGGEIDTIIERNGKYYILDYKTKNKQEHEENDIESCIQAIIYAYLYKQKFNIEVEGCYFLYTKFNIVVPFDHPFEQVTKDNIQDKVSVFKAALESKTFLRVNDEGEKSEHDACKYCNWKHLC